MYIILLNPVSMGYFPLYRRPLQPLYPICENINPCVCVTMGTRPYVRHQNLSSRHYGALVDH